MQTRESELEFELEGEDEYEDEYEGEYEGEEFLGTVANVGRNLLGLGEGEYEEEYEDEFEGEFEYEGEYEEEEFLRRIARGVGSFARRAAPILRNVARVAAPMVGTAVGGVLGGPLGARVGSMAGRAAGSLLREGEFEEEGEFEDEGEFEEEYEFEAVATGPMTQQQALGELMAAVAARARTDAEAEAMVGASTVASISPADRAALRNVLPHLVRGTAVLTRVLRRNAATRPAVRAVPAIVRRTSQQLARRAQTGRPVTRGAAARVMANQTRRVLSSPRTCASAIQRNVQGTRAAARGGTAAAGTGRRPRPAAAR